MPKNNRQTTLFNVPKQMKILTFLSISAIICIFVMVAGMKIGVSTLTKAPAFEKAVSDNAVTVFACVTTATVDMLVLFVPDVRQFYGHNVGAAVVVPLLVFVLALTVYNFIATCVNAIVSAIKESKPE